jgi:hypothetical protein
MPHRNSFLALGLALVLTLKNLGKYTTLSNAHIIAYINPDCNGFTLDNILYCAIMLLERRIIMPIRRRLDIPMNILVTAPVKIALQRVADENMISVSDIVRAAINAAVPVQFDNYQTYLTEATEELDEKYKSITKGQIK